MSITEDMSTMIVSQEIHDGQRSFILSTLLPSNVRTIRMLGENDTIWKVFIYKCIEQLHRHSFTDLIYY